MATLTNPLTDSVDLREEAHQEDLEAARTVSAVLFTVLAIGIGLGVIGLFWALSI